MTTLAVTASLMALGISVLALLVVIGAVRRMRAGGWSKPAGSDSLPAIGVRVPSFDFVDIDGRPVGSDRLATGRHAVAFVSSACDACLDSLPELVRFAGSVGTDRCLAVLYDDSDDAAVTEQMLGSLAGTSTVLVERDSREVSTLFGVDSFPTFLGVQDGIVRVSSHRVVELTRWHAA